MLFFFKKRPILVVAGNAVINLLQKMSHLVQTFFLQTDNFCRRSPYVFQKRCFQQILQYSYSQENTCVGVCSNQVTRLKSSFFYRTPPVAAFEFS